MGRCDRSRETRYFSLAFSRLWGHRPFPSLSCQHALVSVVTSILTLVERDVIFHGTAAAVLALLRAARVDGVIVNRTKLAKLLYLADLRAVEQGLPPGTSVEWRWRHYGPYSDILLRVEGDLERAEVIEAQRAEILR